MPEFPVITSLQNPRLKSLVRLREARHRRRSGHFLIEGERETARALQANWPLTTVFFCPEFFHRPEAADLLDQLVERGVEAVQLSREAFAKVSFREGPDGILTLARIREHFLSEMKTRAPALLLVVEGVEKPGNLGAIMRTANAAGVDGMLVCEAAGDLYNPNVIRASQGACFDLPSALCTSREALEWLQAKQIVPIATSPRGESSLWEADLRRPVAIVLGAEDSGLTEGWFQAPAETVQLPMRGITDSLNISVAAGIVLFEAVRQRSP